MYISLLVRHLAQSFSPLSRSSLARGDVGAGGLVGTKIDVSVAVSALDKIVLVLSFVFGRKKIPTNQNCSALQLENLEEQSIDLK